MVILQLDQQPLLIQAIFTGELEEVRSALEFKQDVNYQDCEKRSPLHAASFKGDAEIAALLLSYGARVNTKDNRWITPLHRACCCGSSDLVSLLLRYQADTTARDKQWQTPLHVAAANNAVECIGQLLDCVPNCNVTDRMGRTALHHAAVNGHNDVVELLLTKGCIANACDKKDCRPIHCAAHMGHVDTIELLLRSGADINAKDRNQYSPLHVAASSGMVSACRVLLRSGAEVDARNAYGNTPLHIACLNGHLPVCNVLVAFGADIEATNYRGQTPLHIAAASTHGVDCLNFLVDQKANINKQSLDGRSPLHMTAIHGRFTRSKTLIDNGAVVDCTDKNGCTALHIAAQYGHDILSNTLLSYGADSLKKGYSGRTPLHMSCLSGYVECCRKFLQAGVNLNAVDDSGKTPIHCAAYKGSVECLDLLVSNGADFQLLDNIGRTPLHYAAVQGHYPCVFTLVGLGSNVNLCDTEGCSPLHLAAAYDVKGECVEYLLRHKADPKLKNKKGFTPIHYAVAGGNLSGLGFLLTVVGNNYIMYGSDMPLTTPLHLAARNGNQDILQLLLSYFHDTNIRTEHGSTALLLAAKAGNTHCVQMLLRYGAKVSITDAIQHMSPVHYSARNGHMHCLALLLDNTEDKTVIDKPDSLQRTALMLAVAGGHADSALTLLKCGADANIVDAEKHSSLFRAVVNGQHNTVQLLLSNGAEVDKSDIHGKNVLHLAAACGHLSSLQTVINTMDSLVMTALDNQSCTALHWACYNGNPNCVSFLLERDIFKELKGNVFSPIHCATFVGADRCIELLCNYYGTDIVKLKDARNRTPLHIAALHGHVDCAKYLLENGAEIDCKDADGRTPLIAAAQNGQSQIIDILLSYKADATSYDNNGNTALHLACLKRHSHAALLLLENIDDVDIVNMINNERKTALHLSARNGLVNVTRQLISKGSSVLAVDATGMTPALCCAPNSSVAQCLALILANYAICSQQNNTKERSTSTPYLPSKRVSSSSATELKQMLQKCTGKKMKIYHTQSSQTDLSLLRDPDHFECQRMFRRHHNSPRKKRSSDLTSAKSKTHSKLGIPWRAMCQSVLNGNNHEFLNRTTQGGGKDNCFIFENYRHEGQFKEAFVEKKVGHDLHRSHSDMLIAQDENQYDLETFNKSMLDAKVKKNEIVEGTKTPLSEHVKMLWTRENEQKAKNQSELPQIVTECAEEQYLSSLMSENFHKSIKEVAKQIVGSYNPVNLEYLLQMLVQVEEIRTSTESQTKSVEERKVSSTQTNLLDAQQKENSTQTSQSPHTSSNAPSTSFDNQKIELKQIIEDAMDKLSEQQHFLQSKSALDDSKPAQVQNEGQLKHEDNKSEDFHKEPALNDSKCAQVQSEGHLKREEISCENHVEDNKTQRFLSEKFLVGDSKPARVPSEGQVKNQEIISESFLRENRMQKITKTYVKKASNKNLKNAIKLQQKKGHLDMKSFEEKCRAAESEENLINKRLKLEASDDSKANDANEDTEKGKIENTLEICKPGICGVVLDDNDGESVQEIYVNFKKPPEVTKLTFAPVPIPKLRIIETANDDDIIKVDQVIRSEQLLEEAEVERTHNCSKKFEDKSASLKQVVDSQLDKSPENFIMEGLKIMRSTKSLDCVAQHVHMLDAIFSKYPQDLSSAVEIMKHILITLKEREWLEKQKSELSENQEKLPKGIVGVELFDEGCSKDIHKTTEELIMKIDSFPSITHLEELKVQQEDDKDLKNKNDGVHNDEIYKTKRVDSKMDIKTEHNLKCSDLNCKKDNCIDNCGCVEVHKETSNKGAFKKAKNLQHSTYFDAHNESNKDLRTKLEDCIINYGIYGTKKEDCSKGAIKKVKNVQHSTINTQLKKLKGKDGSGKSLGFNQHLKNAQEKELKTQNQKNSGLPDGSSIHLERECSCSDTIMHKHSKLTTFHVEPTEITSNTSLTTTSVQTGTGSASSLTQQNVGIYDSNCDLYSLYTKSLLYDEEIPPVGKEETTEKEKAIEEIGAEETHRPKKVISGTISLVPYLEVQNEMKMTLESVGENENMNSETKIGQKKNETLEDIDSEGNIKTLYVNLSEDEDRLVEETVAQCGFTQSDEDLQPDDEKELSSTNLDDLHITEELISKVQEEISAVQKFDDLSEPKIVLEDSNSDDVIRAGKSLKCGKKNSYSNIAKKKLLKSRESSQCCIS